MKTISPLATCILTLLVCYNCHGLEMNRLIIDKFTFTQTMQNDSIYYSCPMHPDVISAMPGSCSKCGMQLEKHGSNEKTQPKMQMKCGMMNGMDNMNHSEVLKTDSTSSTKQDSGSYYTCTMHPDVKSNKPGTCPKCGMTLVKHQDKNGTKVKKPKMKMGCGMM